MAATGTPTPNIGLRIPQGTDPASVDDINYNSNLLDTKLGAVGNDSVQDQINDLNSNFATYKQADSFTVSSGYDTRYVSSVTGYIQNGVLTIYITVKSGLAAGWYNGVSLNLPEKYRPNSTIYSTHRINSAADAGKSIYGILSSAGGLQFYTSDAFSGDIPIMFVGPANG